MSVSTESAFGPAVRALGYVWDVDTLSVVLAQQAVIEGGTIVVGSVDQGAGGVSAWKVDGSAVTQPVSLSGSVAVTGPLTDAQLRATPVPVTSTPSGTQNVDPVANTIGLATGAKQDTGNASLSSLDAKVTAVNTGAVVVNSSALPSGAATAALQLPDGHNVTIDNAAGAAAVNIQDGGNSITVDGTVAISGTVATSGTSYIVRLDEASETITYVGQAVPGTASSAASWAIKRLDSTSGLVVLWAAGAASFNQIWDNRASLAYS